jgi:hypothetical protein
MFKPSTTRLAALAMAASAIALAGCDSADVEINGQKGVPLSEIAIAGPAPTEVFLASGDNVILTEGNTFAIKAEGTDTESLRFVRDKELIGITREDGWNGENKATIRITMPAPREVIIGGAGTITAPVLASEADINIGGAGDVKVAGNAKCTINAMGSGTLTCTPTAAAALPTAAPAAAPAAKPAE